MTHAKIISAPMNSTAPSDMLPYELYLEEDVRVPPTDAKDTTGSPDVANKETLVTTLVFLDVSKSFLGTLLHRRHTYGDRLHLVSRVLDMYKSRPNVKYFLWNHDCIETTVDVLKSRNKLENLPWPESTGTLPQRIIHYILENPQLGVIQLVMITDCYFTRIAVKETVRLMLRMRKNRLLFVDVFTCNQKPYDDMVFLWAVPHRVTMLEKPTSTMSNDIVVTERDIQSLNHVTDINTLDEFIRYSRVLKRVLDAAPGPTVTGKQYADELKRMIVRVSVDCFARSQTETSLVTTLVNLVEHHHCDAITVSNGKIEHVEQMRSEEALEIPDNILAVLSTLNRNLYTLDTVKFAEMICNSGIGKHAIGDRRVVFDKREAADATRNVRDIGGVDVWHSRLNVVNNARRQHDDRADYVIILKGTREQFPSNLLGASSYGADILRCADAPWFRHIHGYLFSNINGIMKIRDYTRLGEGFGIVLGACEPHASYTDAVLLSMFNVPRKMADVMYALVWKCAMSADTRWQGEETAPSSVDLSTEMVLEHRLRRAQCDYVYRTVNVPRSGFSQSEIRDSRLLRWFDDMLTLQDTPGGLGPFPGLTDDVKRAMTEHLIWRLHNRQVPLTLCDEKVNSPSYVSFGHACYYLLHRMLNPTKLVNMRYEFGLVDPAREFPGEFLAELCLLAGYKVHKQAVTTVNRYRLFCDLVRRHVEYTEGGIIRALRQASYVIRWPGNNTCRVVFLDGPATEQMQRNIIDTFFPVHLRGFNANEIFEMYAYATYCSYRVSLDETRVNAETLFPIGPEFGNVQIEPNPNVKLRNVYRHRGTFYVESAKSDSSLVPPIVSRWGNEYDDVGDIPICPWTMMPYYHDVSTGRTWKQVLGDRIGDDNVQPARIISFFRAHTDYVRACSGFPKTADDFISFLFTKYGVLPRSIVSIAKGVLAQYDAAMDLRVGLYIDHNGYLAITDEARVISKRLEMEQTRPLTDGIEAIPEETVLERGRQTMGDVFMRLRSMDLLKYEESDESEE